MKSWPSKSSDLILDMEVDQSELKVVVTTVTVQGRCCQTPAWVLLASPSCSSSLQSPCSVWPSCLAELCSSSQPAS